MYAELRMEVESTQLDYRKSSNLQGVLMEKIDSSYAERLHESQLNPYSQFLVDKGGQKFWHIMALNQEAYQKIILPLAALEEFSLKNGQIKVNVIRRQIETCSEKTLLEEFYDKPGDRYLNIRFLTPTAFKQDGHYVNYPDLRLLFGSLMRKYSQASERLGMTDEETLDQLSKNCEIVKYHLRTAMFPLEKVNITGFVGTICVHVRGTDTMARYARLLLRFGKYTGVGIKAGIGMGATELLGREGMSSDSHR